jgi:hypothetical protein
MSKFCVVLPRHGAGFFRTFSSLVEAVEYGRRNAERCSEKPCIKIVSEHTLELAELLGHNYLVIHQGKIVGTGSHPS